MVAVLLLDISFGDPAWLTSDPQGFEAGQIIFPLIALLFGLVYWRDPGNRPQALLEPVQSTSQFQ